MALNALSKGKSFSRDRNRPFSEAIDLLVDHPESCVGFCQAVLSACRSLRARGRWPQLCAFKGFEGALRRFLPATHQ